MKHRHLAACFLVFALALLVPGAPAFAQDRYAAFVADMDTGEVLHARRPDATRYPASLTKMMTLYMLFDALERGELTLASQLTMSAEAASRPPSKLGVPAGGTISVETAIRALVIRSANDVAVMVAERLGGSETAFASQMTDRGVELGLTATVFRNASGLPDASQRTTARDMARLAHALHRDFPQYFHYFNERSFTHAGRTYTTHNTLVGRVRGVDGMKTGYIRASGFNIAVTAERDGRRLVTVVMGGATGPVRDAHATELVEAAFSTFDARRDGMILANLSSPRISPIREQEILTAELSGLPGPTAMGSAAGESGEAAPPVRIVVEDIPDLVRPGRDTGSDRVRFDSTAPATLPVASASQPAARAASGGWAVQVGAFGSRAVAQARLETVLGLAPALSGATQVTEEVTRDGRSLWRARFEAIDPATARQVCAELARLNEACFAVNQGA
ncbi:D-alanyl-D-alanine carboxypeptidase [Glycocaulis alkaliphilus]|uniref:D-alanyl-D-alanine carboxypeptidase n=1 Tax=Glycocaulis alkaliphilus TaxID=1434191 RepID=A0A3T0E9V8_9PROT|nr:serine hydrolase [Glycocaulis alkaliphilus]AZU03838.1 D-alanyl-D-alanine carboxypeptidase [Glycocaulis alkaliphilus]GGB86591.1 peptidase S11 [Glycocaulis alkaliphilus]